MLNTAPNIKPIKGDARSLSIAAASIMAKETRDQIMIALDEAHPGYGWALIWDMERLTIVKV